MFFEIKYCSQIVGFCFKRVALIGIDSKLYSDNPHRQGLGMLTNGQKPLRSPLVNPKWVTFTKGAFGVKMDIKDDL